jgi:transcriptional regulator with XRE-family HTH domain
MVDLCEMRLCRNSDVRSSSAEFCAGTVAGGGFVRLCEGQYGFRMSDEQLSLEENNAISQLIKEELARRRMTRAALAVEAKLSLSTLEKAMSGQRPFTMASVVRLETALNLKLRNGGNGGSRLAPDSLGSYGRPAVQWLEGKYVAMRSSFSEAGILVSYMVEIMWDAGKSHLVFRESERMDPAYGHDGLVSVPHQSGHIYLVTNRHGQYRLSVLSRPMITGEMYGLLTTLHLGRGSQLTPVSTPIVLCPLSVLGVDVAFGKINTENSVYGRYAGYLKRAVEDPFVLMVQAKT